MPHLDMKFSSFPSKTVDQSTKFVQDLCLSFSFIGVTIKGTTSLNGNLSANKKRF